MEEEIIDTTAPGFTDAYTFINKAEAPAVEDTKVSHYIAILTGKGEGCDYTIGCNRTTIDVEGQTLKEAEHNLAEKICYEYGDFSELESRYGLFDILLVGVAQSQVIDMQAYIDQEKLEEQLEAQREADLREQSEYERLKVKFGA